MKLGDQHHLWLEDAKKPFPIPTKGVNQFIRQAEIDVLGICIAQGQIESLIATDIAFHSLGLLYVNTAETKNRVAKKLYRTALTLDAFFPGIPAEIMFLSPKASPAVVEVLDHGLKQVETFFATRCEHFSFDVILNGRFKNEILDDVIKLKKDVADTSELFLRAVQLRDLFN